MLIETERLGDGLFVEISMEGYHIVLEINMHRYGVTEVYVYKNDWCRCFAYSVLTWA